MQLILEPYANPASASALSVGIKVIAVLLVPSGFACAIRVNSAAELLLPQPLVG